MINKKKVCGLLLVGALAMTTVGTGLLVNSTVEADAADEADTRFEMTGAAVRFDDPTGLRFEALVGVDLATAENVEFGMIIFPKNIMEMYNISTEYSATTNYHTEITTKAAEYVAQYPLIDMAAEPQAVYAETDTEKTTPINYTLWGSIAEIQYENLARDWWGVAYAKEGDTYTYAEFSNDVNVRNVVYVASAAASDSAYNYSESQINTLKGFVSKAMYKVAGKTEEEANTLVANKEWATFTPTVSAETATLEFGATQKLSVVANDLTLGAEWASDNESVATVNKYGVVEAVGKGTATVTANCMGSELSCVVTVNAPAEFTYVPANVYGLKNGESYTVPMATASNGATVTWTAQDYIAQSDHESFGTKLTGPWNSAEHTDVKLSIANVDFIKITYTLTLGDYTENAYTFVCRSLGLNLSEIYGEYVPNMTTTGDMSVSEYEVVDGEGGSIRLYNETGSASGKMTFPTNMYLGDSATTFSFFIYNASDKPVTLVNQWDTSGRNLVVPAKTLIYDGWIKRFGAAALNWVAKDKVLTGFSWTAEAEEGAVELYFGGFNTNSDAFDGALTVETKAQFTPLNTATVIPEYTVSEKMLAAGAEVTWTAEAWRFSAILDGGPAKINVYMTKDEANKTVTITDQVTTAKIIYTLKFNNYEVKEYAYIMPNFTPGINSAEMTTIDAVNANWASEGTYTNATVATGFIKDCTTLLTNGEGQLTYTNATMTLGSNLNRLDIVVINDTDEAMTINPNGQSGSYTIPAHSAASFNMNHWGVAVHTIWGVVTSENTLNLTQSTSNAGVHITFRVNADFAGIEA